MLTLGLIIFCAISGNLNGLELDDNANKLYDFEWQCDSICVGSGGDAEYDQKNHICKCKLDERKDDIDLELLKKNVRTLGILLDLPEFHKKSAIKKRDTDTLSVGKIRKISPIGPTRHRPTLTTTTRRPTTRRPTTKRVNSPSRDIQKRLESIQKRFNDRMRSRPVPRLQQRSNANLDDKSKPNILEQLRERQKELIERLQTRSSISTHQTTGDKSVADQRGRNQIIAATIHKPPSNQGKSGNVEIITQPPNLYANDD